MSASLLLIADLLVAVLLVACVASSIKLSRRINRLKADENAMRQTIGELLNATSSAERAIAGLRTTLGECDRTLGERLRTAERYAADLSEQVEAGEHVMARIMKIVDSSRDVAAIASLTGRGAGTYEHLAAPASMPAPSAPRAPAAFAPAASAPAPAGDRISAAAQALSERAARRLESHGGVA